MLDKILTQILSTTLFISSAISSTPSVAPEHVFTKVLPEENYVSYTVQKDESISQIAFKFYEDEAYWEAIWKENSWIKDPNLLEEGMVLKISTKKPNLTENSNRLYTYGEAVEPQVQAATAQMQTVTPVQPTVVQPTVAQAPAATYAGGPLSEEQINYLGSCEAGMDPAKNTGNGYYGAFQFSASTWNSMGTGYARADLAPLDVQKAAVQKLLSRSSINTQFPGCARKMRSAGII